MVSLSLTRMLSVESCVEKGENEGEEKAAVPPRRLVPLVGFPRCEHRARRHNRVPFSSRPDEIWRSRLLAVFDLS
jgi:hypothetical protein